MLVLERNGLEVTCNGRKLTVVAQATKGPGNEVVKIEGLEGANGAKWISLSKLQPGKNEVDTKAKEVTAHITYTLNMVEKAEVDKLQARINEIKEVARKRYEATPKFKPVTEMNAQELEVYIAYLNSLKTK